MMGLHDVVVKERYIECGAIAVLELASANGNTLPEIEAGAHIDVHLPNGLIRQYSLCQDPKQIGIFRLGILKDPQSRGGSTCAFEQLTPGMHLQVSAPRNLFPLVDASHSILIGGGIGITPLITMAYELLAKGKSFELHYCGSSRERCAFVDEIEQGALASFTTFHFKAEGSSHREY